MRTKHESLSTLPAAMHIIICTVLAWSVVCLYRVSTILHVWKMHGGAETTST